MESQTQIENLGKKCSQQAQTASAKIEALEKGNEKNKVIKDLQENLAWIQQGAEKLFKAHHALNGSQKVITV